MSAVLGILFLILVVPYLARNVTRARNAAWTGPRTAGQRGRAARGGASGANPRQVRAKARADAYLLQKKAEAQNWLEQQRHSRKNGTASTGEPAGSAPQPVRTAVIKPPSLWRRKVRPSAPQPASQAGDGSANGTAPSSVPGGASRRWVPDHEADPQGRIRGPAVRVLAATGAWKLLPGRAQGALCGCATCQGTHPHEPAANGNGQQPANGTPVPRPAGTAAPEPGLWWAPPADWGGRPPASPQPAPSGSNGGTPVAAGTSTASAEKLIEGINEIHAHAAMGGIRTGKQEGIKASHEGLIRFAAMLVMLSRQMSEPGMNYGPEITEPLAQAGQHCQAAAMAASEADAALSTLINMTVGDLAASPRQAPHHAELSENGAR